MSDFDQTSSGIPVKPVYGPGQFPFTRGNYPSGYRGRLRTFRQYSGFGTPEESNRRYRYPLEQGGTGLSVPLGLPTQCGYDSDDPEMAEEVGRAGVAIDTLADTEILFENIPLDKVSTRACGPRAASPSSPAARSPRRTSRSSVRRAPPPCSRPAPRSPPWWPRSAP